jgi:hypothetical protein
MALGGPSIAIEAANPTPASTLSAVSILLAGVRLEDSQVPSSSGTRVGAEPFRFWLSGVIGRLSMETGRGRRYWQ